MRFLRPLASASLSLAALALVACGGSVGANGATDAGSDGSATDSGATDSGGSTDGGGTDSPVARIPKQHRPAPTTCAPSTGGGGTACSGGGGGPPGACKADKDCTAGTNGHCEPAAGGIFMCACFYDTCKVDGDCKGGEVCACQNSPYQAQANGCAPAGDCKVDADCGAGGYCSPSSGAGCSDGLTGYYCHTSSDECVDDSDCSASGMPQQCRFDTTKKHWTCQMMAACA